MSKKVYMRHNISDKVWGLLKPLLTGRRGSWGGVAIDNRRFKCDNLDIKNRGPMARFTAIIWRLEKYSQAILSLEK